MRVQETQISRFCFGKANSRIIGLLWSSRTVGWRESEKECMGKTWFSNHMDSN